MRRLALVIFATVGFSQVAVAADLPTRMPVKAAPAMAPVWSWTGWYIGGNVGGLWANNSTITELAPAIAGDQVYNLTGGVQRLGSTSSITGGVQAGYNYQFGSMVLGIEADINALSYRPSAAEVNPVTGVPLAGGDTIGSKKATWLGTVRGRLGVAAFDRSLIYLTGGVAFSNLKYSVSDTCNVAPCGGGLNNGSVTAGVGYALGGGMEYAINNNWSLKGEYLFASFSGKDFRTINNGGPLTTLWSADRTGFHQARLGLNWKL